MTLGLTNNPRISLELGCKVRMVGELEPPQAMRPKAMCTRYPLHQADPDPRLGHPRAIPMVGCPCRGVWPFGLLAVRHRRIKRAPVSCAQSDVRSPVQPQIRIGESGGKPQANRGVRFGHGGVHCLSCQLWEPSGIHPASAVQHGYYFDLHVRRRLR